MIRVEFFDEAVWQLHAAPRGAYGRMYLNNILDGEIIVAVIDGEEVRRSTSDIRKVTIEFTEQPD